MSKNSEFFRKQRRSAKVFFLVFPFWIAAIVGINIWSDIDHGKPFDMSNVTMGLGMILGAGAIYLFVRGILGLVERMDGHFNREHDK